MPAPAWSDARMSTTTRTTTDVIAAAHGFLAAHARVLDRRRFERLFARGEAASVRDAVAAYRNADGGFGHALEPDGRGPGSQPAAAQLALRVLHEADAWDEGLIHGVLGWLERTAPPEGGTTFVDPSVEGWPHAPWWQPQEGLPPSLITTGPIAGTLHARGVRHPWLDRTTELLYGRAETLHDAGPYDVRGVLDFLQHAPDRERARALALEIGRRAVDRGVITVDPGAQGEVHGVLDAAPLPDSLLRPLFDEATVEAHLDRLAAAQREDGGWMFNWPAWSPAAESDWRGAITVDALVVLRANGRL
jgi:hypothetical protein